MKPEIVIAIVTSASTLVAAIVSIIVNNSLIGYKVDELKRQMEKHNNLVERIAIMERDVKTAFNQINTLSADIKEIRGDLK